MSKNTTNPVSSDAARPSRRWFRIGPATIIALAIAALLIAQWLKTETARRQQSELPPMIERQVISSSSDEKAGPTPDVSFIIERAGLLRLNDSQLSRLRGLQSDWQKYYGSRMADARTEVEKVERYMSDAKNRKPVPTAQIQREAAPVIAISGEISSAKQSYWRKALKLLDPAQAKQVQAEREKAWAKQIRGTR